MEGSEFIFQHFPAKIVMDLEKVVEFHWSRHSVSIHKIFFPGYQSLGVVCYVMFVGGIGPE